MLLSIAVQDQASGIGKITLRHHFCAAAQMELALHAINALNSEFDFRELVTLFDAFIITVLLSFYQSLASSLGAFTHR